MVAHWGGDGDERDTGRNRRGTYGVEDLQGFCWIKKYTTGTKLPTSGLLSRGIQRLILDM